jgi:EAL domain-containing protein (putative c-di-GMP-specific phosphodiesterase class I)
MRGIATATGRLRRAIDTGQLRLDYQPKADMRTGEIVGVEALARWDTPRRGPISPDEFVPHAERKPRSLALLTEWTLDTAFRQAREWHETGRRLTVAVNVSPRSVLDPALVDTFATLLERHRVPKGLIQAELTETAVFGVTQPERVAETLAGLSGLGVLLALDDFGTGYSSLTHLRELPIDKIKIDKSFVLRMDERPNDALIVRSVIGLAKNLGLRVVAEGVERDTVWRRLSDLGCDVAQGNYLSPPLSPDGLIGWVRQWEELYQEAHRMADELLERRLGLPDRRAGVWDRRERREGRRFVPREARSRQSGAATSSLQDREL